MNTITHTHTCAALGVEALATLANSCCAPKFPWPRKTAATPTCMCQLHPSLPLTAAMSIVKEQPLITASAPLLWAAPYGITGVTTHVLGEQQQQQQQQHQLVVLLLEAALTMPSTLSNKLQGGHVARTSQCIALRTWHSTLPPQLPPLLAPCCLPLYTPPLALQLRANAARSVATPPAPPQTPCTTNRRGPMMSMMAAMVILSTFTAAAAGVTNTGAAPPPLTPPLTTAADGKSLLNSRTGGSSTPPRNSTLAGSTGHPVQQLQWQAVSQNGSSSSSVHLRCTIMQKIRQGGRHPRCRAKGALGWVNGAGTLLDLLA